MPAVGKEFVYYGHKKNRQNPGQKISNYQLSAD